MKIINSTVDLNRNNDYLDLLKKMSVEDLSMHMKLHYDNKYRNQVMASVKQYAADYHIETEITIIIETHELEAILKILNLQVDNLNGFYTMQLYGENDDKYPSIQLRIATSGNVEATLYVYGEVHSTSPRAVLEVTTIEELIDQLSTKVFTKSFIDTLSEELKKKIVIKYQE